MNSQVNIHKLLARQLRRCFGTLEISESLRPFLDSVNEAYREFDADRALSERSMTIASAELVEQNRQLQLGNATLREVHDQLRDQTLISETLLKIGQVVAAELDLDKLLEAVAQQAMLALGAKFSAVFFTPSDEPTADFPLHLLTGIPQESFCQAGLNILAALAAAVLRGPGWLLCGDLDHEALQTFGVKYGEFPASLHTARSCIVVGITSRTGQVLGGLMLGHDGPGTFSDRDLRLLQGIAAQAAIAIDNARLFKAAQDATKRLSHLALHDSLTGLPNRTLFRDRVQLCIDRAKRRQDYHYAVLFLDLDRFKFVNDTMGHGTGDQLLRQVGERLQACVRGTDTLSRASIDVTTARMGGDEFTVLLDDLTSGADAQLVARRIVDSISAPYHINGQSVNVSASVGVAHDNKNYHSAEEILRDADAAMYHAKAAGKAQFAVFDVEIHKAVLQRMRLESELQRAIERRELRLMYQPIVSLSTRELVGFEALIRWQHDGRVISPAEFIPIAEEVGLIVPIGEWVLQEACRQMRIWKDQHPSLAPLTVSVNLSRRQLPEKKLIQQIRDALRATRLDPHALSLEVTETVIMEDLKQAQEFLREIRAMGVGVQLDDFGTGYSSLSCLNKLPLTGLKIDRSFISDLAAQRDCVAVLQAMMTLAHNLQTKVVAEGLEHAEQVALMQALDCDYGQGFFFAKPLAPEQAIIFATAPHILAA